LPKRPDKHFFHNKQWQQIELNLQGKTKSFKNKMNGFFFKSFIEEFLNDFIA